MRIVSIGRRLGLVFRNFNKEWLSGDSVNNCSKNKLEDKNPITVYPSVDHYRGGEKMLFYP